MKDAYKQIRIITTITIQNHHGSSPSSFEAAMVAFVDDVKTVLVLETVVVVVTCTVVAGLELGVVALAEEGAITNTGGKSTIPSTVGPDALAFIATGGKSSMPPSTLSELLSVTEEDEAAAADKTGTGGNNIMPPSKVFDW
jgi:hypothetical protein